MNTIWLIARREISTRLRQKSWKITTVVMVVLSVAGVLVAHFAAGGISHPQFTIATTSDVPASTSQAIVTQAQAVGATVTVASTSMSQDQGQAQVRDGSLDALIMPAQASISSNASNSSNPSNANSASSSSGASASASPGASLELVVNQSADSTLQAIVTSVAQEQELASQITALGGEPATVLAAVAQAGVTVTALQPPPVRDTTQVVVALAVMVVMYVAMLMGSQFVAQGVVEEKTSRVVEILLSTVRPMHLMAGKVMGIGLVTLLQVGLTVGAAAVTATRTGLLDTSQLPLGATLLWSLAWLLVGFAMFSLMLAGLASLVSRQEEVGAVTTPALMLAIIPYVYGVAFMLHNPTATSGLVMSLVPFFAPFLMPMRVALGVAAAWEQWLSLGLALAFLPLLAYLAGRIYQGAVLKTGARVKLSDALRRAA